MLDQKQFSMAKLASQASIAFIVILLALHLLKPELDPSWNFISEYQVGRFGWLMSLAFASLALSCLALSVALWNKVKLAGKIGISLLVVSAAGMLIAAVFKTDPLGTSPDQVTEAGKLHQLGAMLDNIPFAAILITIALFKSIEHTTHRLALIGSLLLVWFGFVYFVLSIRMQFPEDGKFGPHVLVGWQNRLMILTQAFWLVMIAQITGKRQSIA